MKVFVLCKIALNSSLKVFFFSIQSKDVSCAIQLCTLSTCHERWKTALESLLFFFSWSSNMFHQFGEVTTSQDDVWRTFHVCCTFCAAYSTKTSVLKVHRRHAEAKNPCSQVPLLIPTISPKRQPITHFCKTGFRFVIAMFKESV